MRINKKPMLFFLFLDIFIGFIIYGAYFESVHFRFNIESSASGKIKIYHGMDKDNLDEEASQTYEINMAKTVIIPDIVMDAKTQYVKLNFDNKSKNYKITDIDIYKSENHQNAMSVLSDRLIANDCEVKISDNVYTIHITGKNPSLLVTIDSEFVQNVMHNTTKSICMLIIMICVIVNVTMLILLMILKKHTFINTMIQNKQLIWNLAKNDFKTKYAGSFFGILWAFVQPIVTILLYWFVFQVGLRSGDVSDVPFVLWLMCGLIPWFFFQEAFTSITNSMIEYSYLVKKMVFQIDILPIVKLVSALFVHFFFLTFCIFIFCLMGYIPSFTALQLVYYLFCSIVLVLGLGYASCSLILFFKDLGQIIQIVLQIGMWMTPILWNIEMMPKEWLWLIKLNPMYYIVSGFRDSLITNTWVWNRLDETLNFWLITIAIFAFGTHIYQKLKCHFADVL